MMSTTATKPGCAEGGAKIEQFGGKYVMGGNKYGGQYGGRMWQKPPATWRISGGVFAIFCLHILYHHLLAQRLVILEGNMEQIWRDFLLRLWAEVNVGLWINELSS